jgi:hypothetical protein|tara:strand:- start:3175 stop:3456 length:282 start_codon:yes stop_codon:yes gene_type:complete
MAHGKTEVQKAGVSVAYWRIEKTTTVRDLAGGMTTQVFFEGWIDKASRDGGKTPVVKRRRSDVSGDLSAVDMIAEAYKKTESEDAFFNGAAEV